MNLVKLTAEDEYKKNAGVLRKEDVKTLREWIDKQPHLPKISDFDIILFLHSCYYSIETAKITIDTHFTVRTHCPEFFTNRTAKRVEACYENAAFYVLEDMTPEGYRLIGLHFPSPDASKFNFSEAIKMFTMVCDLWLLETGTANGIIFYIDMTNVVWGHVTRLGIMPMKKILFYLQEALQFRLKGLHFVNAVSFIDKILALMKPFMKKDLMDVLYIHQNAEGLYKHVEKSILPSNLGGGKQHVSVYVEEFKKKLIENTEWFIEDEKIRRIDETKRSGRAKNAGDLFGIEGSFKKLDLD